MCPSRAVNFKLGGAISAESYRINQQIRSRQVRLIGAEGENIGVVSIQEAQRIADSEDLDLVEVAPNADPPVCRVMNFGKFIYEHEKKEREARKAQTKIEVKEIRLRPKTNPHHRFFKVRDARKWLEAGMKVKVRIRFRGREITYPELAIKDLQEVAEELKDVAIVEQEPGREGRSLLMVLGPSKTKTKKPATKPESAKTESSETDIS
jgi:translation initiation factor IF-3